MSNLRIKYIEHKYKDNHKISGKAFISSSTGASYRIVLNLEAMEYYIRNERTKEFVFKSKKYTNLNVLKRKARNELSRFGVKLGKESRDRQFGLCPKGMTQKKWEMLKEMEEGHVE